MVPVRDRNKELVISPDKIQIPKGFHYATYLQDIKECFEDDDIRAIFLDYHKYDENDDNKILEFNSDFNSFTAQLLDIVLYEKHGIKTLSQTKVLDIMHHHKLCFFKSHLTSLFRSMEEEVRLDFLFFQILICFLESSHA